MQEDSFQSRLKRFMEYNHLSQQTLASEVNISQASVSRALSRSPQRQGQAIRKISIYMQQHSSGRITSHGKAKVVEAFESIWDGTDEHAKAIARIINASDGLRPVEHFTEGE